MRAAGHGLAQVLQDLGNAGVILRGLYGHGYDGPGYWAGELVGFLMAGPHPAGAKVGQPGGLMGLTTWRVFRVAKAWAIGPLARLIVKAGVWTFDVVFVPAIGIEQEGHLEQDPIRSNPIDVIGLEHEQPGIALGLAVEFGQEVGRFGVVRPFLAGYGPSFGVGVIRASRVDAGGYFKDEFSLLVLFGLFVSHGPNPNRDRLIFSGDLPRLLSLYQIPAP